MAAIVLSSNEMATPFSDVEGCSSKVVIELVQVSSQHCVGFFFSDLSLSKVLINLWVDPAKLFTLAWLKWLNHQTLASPSKCNAATYTTSLSIIGCSRKNAWRFLAQALAIYDPSNLDNRNLLPYISFLLQGLLSSFNWMNCGRARVCLKALGWDFYSKRYLLRI